MWVIRYVVNDTAHMAGSEAANGNAMVDPVLSKSDVKQSLMSAKRQSRFPSNVPGRFIV